MILIHIILLLAFLTLLLVSKFPLHFTLIFASLLIALEVLMNPLKILSVFYKTLLDKDMIMLAFAIYFILLLGKVFEKFRLFSPIFSYLRHTIGPKRLIPIFPALIGMLPMLGGAIFSAPFVSEASEGLKLKPEDKVFFNYWFRHIWEYFFPLYSGVVMTVAIFKISMTDMFIHQGYLTLVAILFGAIYLNIKLKDHKIKSEKSFDSYVDSGFFIPFIPFIIIIIGIVLKLNYAFLTFIAAIPFSYYICKNNDHSFLNIFKQAFSAKMMLMVFAVFLFKNMLNDSGIVYSFGDYISKAGGGEYAILFILPFLIGLLTGVSNAFVGITFPLLYPLIYHSSGVDFGRLAFAYTAGFSGVLLSPLHFCLVLTNEYFNAKLSKVYPILFLGCLVLIGGSLWAMFL